MFEISAESLFGFTYTYVLPIVLYLFVMSKYIAFKQGENDKIPFK